MNTPYQSYILLVLILATGILSSCKDDTPEVKEYYSVKLDGTYDLISLTSQTPVDLDMDEVYSTDMLKETHQDDTSDIMTYEVQLATEIKDSEKNNYIQIITLWIPYPNVVSDDKGNYLYTEYGFTNLQSRYRYYEEMEKIEIFNPRGNGEILAANISGDTLLTVTFNQMHFTKDGWEKITINGKYNRSK